MFCFNTIITDPAERFEGRTVIDYPVGNDGSGDDSQHAPEQNKTIESKEGGRAEPQWCTEYLNICFSTSTSIGHITVAYLVAKPFIWNEAEDDLVVIGAS